MGIRSLQQGVRRHEQQKLHTASRSALRWTAARRPWSVTSSTAPFADQPGPCRVSSAPAGATAHAAPDLARQRQERDAQPQAYDPGEDLRGNQDGKHGKSFQAKRWPSASGRGSAARALSRRLKQEEGETRSDTGQGGGQTHGARYDQRRQQQRRQYGICAPPRSN